MPSEEALVALAGFMPMSMGIAFDYIDGPNQHAVFIESGEGHCLAVTLPEVRELARAYLKLLQEKSHV